MTLLLFLGFLLGMRHALEADHVAAVASLAARSGRIRDTVRVASWWATGHGATLIVLGSVFVVLGASLPEHLERTFEAIVGLVLVALGGDVLRRLRSERVHFHVHEHAGTGQHLHAHAHEEDGAHDASHHEHEHPRGLLTRSFAVGSLHGLAGSGALVLLSTERAGSPARAVAYLVLFALGSVLGMVAFSIAISLPMRLSSRWLENASGGVQMTLGALSIALGLWVTVRAMTS